MKLLLFNGSEAWKASLPGGASPHAITGSTAPPPPTLPIPWDIDLENIQLTLQVAYKEKSWKNSREIPNFL